MGLPQTVTDCSTSAAPVRRRGSIKATQGKGGRPTATFKYPPATELFRKYSINDKLGEGAYGTVWRCVDRATGAAAACKQMSKNQGLGSVMAEVECLSRVQGHQNVLRLEGVYESETQVFLVTELCDGGDLFERLQQDGATDEEESRETFRQIVAAVHHCHVRGVLHRDIKPENILLHTDPTTGRAIPKLADFGLSVKLEQGATATGWVGSEPYEAPEMLASKPYDFAADAFSLGVLLYGILSASWPHFLEPRVFKPQESFSWPAWQTISEDARNLITRMLTADPSLRPSTAEILSSPWLCAEGGQGVRDLPSLDCARSECPSSGSTLQDDEADLGHSLSRTVPLCRTFPEASGDGALLRVSLDDVLMQCGTLSLASSRTVDLHRTRAEGVAHLPVAASSSMSPEQRSQALGICGGVGVGEDGVQWFSLHEFDLSSAEWTWLSDASSDGLVRLSSLSSRSSRSDASEVQSGLAAVPQYQHNVKCSQASL